uniref:Uncharacterized protein n=1 Tax=Athene cunicularia TaxID=194338 RepID=A0A663MQ37_ATHCN
MRKNAYAALPECHPLVICSTDGLPLCLEALFQSTIHSCNKLPITGSTDTIGPLYSEALIPILQCSQNSPISSFCKQFFIATKIHREDLVLKLISTELTELQPQHLSCRGLVCSEGGCANSAVRHTGPSTSTAPCTGQSLHRACLVLLVPPQSRALQN